MSLRSKVRHAPQYRALTALLIKHGRGDLIRSSGLDADLIGEDDAAVLQQSWRRVSRVRNAVTLVRGKPADELPRDLRERAAVAAILGYPPGSSDAMVNDQLRYTRLARAVVDRIFWE
jgi:glutamate-ammonia-ligase adenylyltransferase